MKTSTKRNGVMGNSGNKIQRLTHQGKYSKMIHSKDRKDRRENIPTTSTNND